MSPHERNNHNGGNNNDNGSDRITQYLMTEDRNRRQEGNNPSSSESNNDEGGDRNLQHNTATISWVELLSTDDGDSKGNWMLEGDLENLATLIERGLEIMMASIPTKKMA